MESRIKLLRKELGLTQEEFARKIGLARNSIANYEIGRREPTNAIITSVCREFNVNEEWLRTGHGEMFLELTREQEIAELTYSLFKDEKDSFKSRFISALSKLDVKDWEVLEKLVVNIVENKKD
ncbi:MAG: helix-turn-helix transcriptional regulator [Lachnospiraceae bacterium]|nr:helix-turn-helix transcriptional regulator [Lachnospiraceae bacterium]